MNVCPSQFGKLASGSDSVGFNVTKAEFYPDIGINLPFLPYIFFTKRVLVFVKALDRYFPEVRALAKTREDFLTAPPKSIFVI